jgi:hypothetical protein
MTARGAPPIEADVRIAADRIAELGRSLRADGAEVIDVRGHALAPRTGLPKDKAMDAARAAVDFLDDRLPAPVGGSLRSMVDEGEGREGGAGIGDAIRGAGDKLKR